MAFKSGIIFIGLLLGSLALPTPESGDLSIFFQNADSQARIVGGTPAPAGAHPWMAALTQGLIFRSFFCGGSIITPRTVLTAAHCISAVFSFGSLSSSLRVTVGTNQWNSGGQTLSVTNNATHLHYVSQTIKNDIGMLFTSSVIQFNNNVQPIALSFDYVGAGVLSRAAGWGQISATGPISNQLLQADVATIGGADCVRDVAQAAADLNFLPPPLEPHIELCTFHAPGRGMCRGDSGSALVRLDQGTQIGVVSWGFPCALGAPDMFVRVSAFQSWINQQSFG